MADVLSVIADVLKQDKQLKREQAKMMKEVQKKLKEKGSEDVAEEPGDKEDYMKFFAGKLKKYGAKSPSELSDEDKKKFFNEIEKDWKHDSSEEVEVEEKEEDLGKRIKSRMEAEEEEEDEDEAPVGDQDEPETEPEDEEESPEEDEEEAPEEDEEEAPEEEEVDMDDPSEDQIDKIADLVVQKLKDKADDEEDEEDEPDSTEAEGGKEEDIDTEPKVENMHRNPHRKNVWIEALRKVNENVRLAEAKGTAYPATIDTLKMIVREKQNQTVMFKSGQAIVDIFTASAMVAVYDAMKPATKKKFEKMIMDKGGFMKTQAFAMKMVEDVKWHDQIKEDPSILETFVITEGGSDWLEDEMNDVQHKWKNTKQKIKVQWLSKIHSKASKEGMGTDELEDRLDDFGLTKFPKEKVWDEARKVKSKWKKMSTVQRTRWIDKIDDIAKKTNTSDADVEAIRDEFGLHMSEEVELGEGNVKPIESAIKKAVKGWKKMSKSDKTKFKSEMKSLASKNSVSNSDLEEILDDYGLTEQKESIGITLLRKYYGKDKQ